MVLLGPTNINLEQMKAGCAWYFKRYATDISEIERLQYNAAKAEAREAKRGLWQQQAILPSVIGSSSKQFLRARRARHIRLRWQQQPAFNASKTLSGASATPRLDSDRCLLLLLSDSVFGAELRGVVDRVVDGDTFALYDNQGQPFRVRS
jgi:endonuclease YncB( thermonuclease family)